MNNDETPIQNQGNVDDSTKNKDGAKSSTVDMDIKNFIFENKDIEATCEDFIESLFSIDPKKYDSIGQSHLKIKKMSIPGGTNIDSKQKLTFGNSATQSKKDYSSNTDSNAVPVTDSIKDKNDKYPSHSSSNYNNNSNRKIYDSEKENNLNLVNNQPPMTKSSGNSSGMTGAVCKDFVNDLFFPKNTQGTDHGDELNIVEKIPKHKHTQDHINQNKNENNIEIVNDNNINNNFQMTPEHVKFLVEHKNDIITIQKNWKTYYDVNRFRLLKSKALILQHFYRKYLIKKYNLPSNFYYNDKFLKMQTELYEDTYKKNLNILFPSLFMYKTDLN